MIYELKEGAEITKDTFAKVSKSIMEEVWGPKNLNTREAMSFETSKEGQEIRKREQKALEKELEKEQEEDSMFNHEEEANRLLAL